MQGQDVFGRVNAKLLKKEKQYSSLISFDKVTFSSRDTPTKEILLLPGKLNSNKYFLRVRTICSLFMENITAAQKKRSQGMMGCTMERN